MNIEGLISNKSDCDIFPWDCQKLLLFKWNSLAQIDQLSSLVQKKLLLRLENVIIGVSSYLE